MAKRSRNTLIGFYVTEEEYSLIEAKMAQAGCANFSLFAREMLLTGEVKCYDFSNLKELSAILGRLAGNINQVAKRCNETHSIYRSDVEELQQNYMEVKAQTQERLVKLLRKI